MTQKYNDFPLACCYGIKYITRESSLEMISNSLGVVRLRRTENTPFEPDTRSYRRRETTT